MGRSETCALLGALLACTAASAHASETFNLDQDSMMPVPVAAHQQFGGPSFPCPVPRDPLAQAICSSTVLSRLDLKFVQTYQALRQQVGPAGQQALRQESVDFGLSVRAACGIANAQSANSKVPPPPPAPPDAEACIGQAYQRQKAVWSMRLTGTAAEEVARTPEQQADRQADLQRLHYLPADALPDGIYGTGTRAAIAAWQSATGRPATGLLGHADAAALAQDNTPAPAFAQDGAPFSAPVAMATPLPQPQASIATTPALVPPTPAPQAPPPPPASPLPVAPVVAKPVVPSGWDELTGKLGEKGLAVSFKQVAGDCAIVTTLDPKTLDDMTGQFISSQGDADAQKNWRAHPYKLGLTLMQAAVSAPTVQQFYANHPDANACDFRVALNDYDVYGQPSPKSLYTFSFDRATYEKINWDHFNPANLAKVAQNFQLGNDATEQLRKEGGDN